MLLSPAHELWKCLEVTKHSSQPGHFIKLRDVMCVRWGWCVRVCAPVCVCFDAPPLTPNSPLQFSLHWLLNSVAANHPLQTCRCSTAKQRAIWMMLLPRQQITDASGDGSTKHGEKGAARQMQMCAAAWAAQSPHREKWIWSSSAEIDKVFYKSDIINAFYIKNG